MFSELLLYFSNVIYGSNPFKLTIARKEIASLISATPESVSRLIGQFKELGIIKGKGNSIEILDFNQLKALGKCETLSIY